MAKRMRKIFLGLATTLTLALCGTIAACGEGGIGGGQQQQPLTMVKQETMKYDGKLLTWEAVSGAEKYSITINGGAEYFSSVNQFVWPAATNLETVDVQIKAVRGEEVTSPAAKMFSRLEKIADSQIYFDETGRMTWDPVSGATEYVIRINGAESRTYATEYVDFTYGQRNSISIMPVGPDNSTFSEWSTAVSKDYLGVPTDIQYDGQFITFKGNNFTSKYMIYINNSAYQEVSSTTVQYDAARASFDLAVQALGDGKDSFSSSISESKTFVHLADVTGFKIENGRLSWDEVDEASGYKVKLNGVEQVTENNYIDDIPAGKENVIQVKPITTAGDVYFANWSEEQTVRLLVAPTLLWKEGLNLDGQTMNAIYWDAVEGDVGGYNMKIKYPSGELEIKQLPDNAVEFGHAFEATGTYEISIQTVPVADSNSYQSAYSAPIRVIRLADPNEVQNFIQSNPTRVSEGFTLNWQSVSGATGYQIWKDGEKLKGTVETTTTKIPYNQIITNDETAAQTFHYYIQALGSEKTFATDRYVTLNSLSASMLEATITVLAQPQDVTFEGFTVSWKEVPSAKGYAINCTGESSVTDTNYDLQNLESGVYNDFSICAKGNGSDLLASNYTPMKKLVRLGAPFDIQLRADSNGDTLVWNTTNSNADHYAVFWSEEPETAVRADQIGDMGQYITTQSRSLNMRAMANYEDVATGIYYITSPKSDTATFTKLQEVTFNDVKVRGNKFIWNEPKNVQGKSITYRVFKNNGVALDGEVTECQYDISTFKAGSYSLCVQAVGGGNFVSSNLSQPAVFDKLETPKVTTPENGTSLTWERVPGEVVKYIVEIEGEIVAAIEPVDKQMVYSYEHKYETIKPNGYAVRVYAQGDGMRTVDSDAWTRTQVVAQAIAPGFEFTYCNVNGEKISFNEANAKFVITIRNSANCYTTDYEIEVGKTSGTIKKSDGETTVYEYAPNQTGTYEARVYATGGVYDAKGVYYVRSVSEAVRKITVHAAPTNLMLTSSQIKWDPVLNADYYLLRYFIKATGEWKEVEVQGATYNLPLGLSDEDISVFEVQAIGNGYDTIGSTKATWTKK